MSQQISYLAIKIEGWNYPLQHKLWDELGSFQVEILRCVTEVLREGFNEKFKEEFKTKIWNM